MSRFEIIQGDCRDVLMTLGKHSVDAIVTDPPYGLNFMGKGWDHGVPGVEFWRAALRVLKPGGHLLAFGGTRTFHRLACAIEDAGFEMRDTIMWVYGQGFPKSLDVGKAVGRLPSAGAAGDAASGDAAYKGWGTALKPAWEPILVCRKPLAGTVAENVRQFGTGGINVDWGRISTAAEDYNHPGSTELTTVPKGLCFGCFPTKSKQSPPSSKGRFPANLIHDGSAEVLALFPPDASPGNGLRTITRRQDYAGLRGGKAFAQRHGMTYLDHGDTGSAARFFYCAKASKADREDGLAGFSLKSPGEATDRPDGSDGLNSPRAGAGRTGGARNFHPTVKPTALMRYLVRLVTPPGGLVMDPFAGSGSTGKAALLEGFRFLGIEREADYCEIARARCAAAAGAV